MRIDKIDFRPSEFLISPDAPESIHGAIYANPSCGCKVSGNGTLPAPLTIEFCQQHAKVAPEIQGRFGMTADAEYAVYGKNIMALERVAKMLDDEILNLCFVSQSKSAETFKQDVKAVLSTIKIYFSTKRQHIRDSLSGS